MPEWLGGKWTWAEFGGDWFSSNKGPWLEYPGDSFGESAKKHLYEEEKKEEFDPFWIEESEENQNQLPNSLAADINPVSSEISENMNNEMNLNEIPEVVKT